MTYIEKEPLCAWLEEMGVSDYIVNTIKSEEHFPTSDVVEVKHGYWIPTDIEQEFFGCIDEATIYKCSLCGRYEDKQKPYCHCGARMDGGSDKE